jgi:hypothetical protein
MLRRLISVLLISSLLLLNSCGTLMYPERRGSKGVKIDPHVAILDALGLLLFIIPGVIAFAVDFTTGCIYLPGGGKGSLDQEPIHLVKSADGHLTPEILSEVVYGYTGKHVTFTKQGDTLVCQVDGKVFKPQSLANHF